MIKKGTEYLRKLKSPVSFQEAEILLVNDTNSMKCLFITLRIVIGKYKYIDEVR